MKRPCLPSMIVVGLVFLLSSQVAMAGPPTEQVKGTVDQVNQILTDPALKGPAKIQERRAKLRRVIRERFDFPEMAKRSLGIHWAKRTPREQEEFLSLFWDLLERSYVDKIESYSDEKIVYVGESIDGDFAVVRSKVVTKRGLEIPLDYRLYRKGESWQVYDIIIEDVSMVSNYRTQFNKIIRSSSYEELVKRMRTKLEGVTAEGL
ncbi:MAG: ABC transporter substrate-binding protein [candidate division NC10 bacterium]|nr:ABC transporter substrate-binding protein [candidate division NC10 bacterium]